MISNMIFTERELKGDFSSEMKRRVLIIFSIVLMVALFLFRFRSPQPFDDCDALAYHLVAAEPTFIDKTLIFLINHLPLESILDPEYVHKLNIDGDFSYETSFKNLNLDDQLKNELKTILASNIHLKNAAEVNSSSLPESPFKKLYWLIGIEGKPYILIGRYNGLFADYSFDLLEADQNGEGNWKPKENGTIKSFQSEKLVEALQQLECKMRGKGFGILVPGTYQYIE